MNKSENINELAVALAKAQGEMKPAKKDKTNPFFRSSYADLGSAMDASREVLTKNGLSIIQAPGESIGDGTIRLDTMLLHASGQYISAVMTLKATKVDPQGMGSAITYARRYAYMSIIGLASEDDDGNEASKPKVQHEKAVETVGQEMEDHQNESNISIVASKAQVAKIQIELKRTGVDKQKIYDSFKVTSLNDLTKQEASKVIEKLVAKVVNSSSSTVNHE